ncbi:hypothetical protein ACFVHQ_03985 [Actinomycetes bacterium NPDC127524]
MTDFKICLIVLGCFFLFGCSQLQTQTESVKKGEMGFITDLQDKKRVLIKNTYYTVSDSTYLKDTSGRKLDVNDLKIGMKVKPWYTGSIKHSHSPPASTEAKLLLVQNDEESLREQQAVLSAIKKLKKGKSERFLVRDFSHIPEDKVYIIEMMRRSNLDTSFTVTVNAADFEVLFY